MFSFLWKKIKDRKSEQYLCSLSEELDLIKNGDVVEIAHNVLLFKIIDGKRVVDFFTTNKANFGGAQKTRSAIYNTVALPWLAGDDYTLESKFSVLPDGLKQYKKSLKKKEVIVQPSKSAVSTGNSNDMAFENVKTFLESVNNSEEAQINWEKAYEAFKYFREMALYD